jgi:hypothetical protein
MVRWKGRINAGQDCQEVSLNVQMARSAQLWQCMSGGTSWKVAFHLKLIAFL